MPVNFSTKNLGLSLDSQPKFSRNPLLEAGLVLVICGLFTWFIILPKQSEVNLKHENYTKVSEQEQGIADKVSKLEAIVNTLHTGKDQITKLDEAMPLDGDFINPRLLLQKLAADSHVTVGDITVSSKSGTVAAGNTDLLSHPFDTPRTQQTMAASAYVLGSFAQLETFLQQIEQSGRLMNVTGLAIGQDSQGQLNMKLTLNMYYLAP